MPTKNGIILQSFQLALLLNQAFGNGSAEFAVAVTFSRRPNRPMATKSHHYVELRHLRLRATGSPHATSSFRAHAS